MMTELQHKIQRCVEQGMSLRATSRSCKCHDETIKRHATPEQLAQIVQNGLKQSGRSTAEANPYRNDCTMVVISDPAEIAAITRQIAANLPPFGRIA